CGTGKAYTGGGGSAVRRAATQLCRTGGAQQSTGPSPAAVGGAGGNPGRHLSGTLAGDGGGLAGSVESGRRLCAAGSRLPASAAGTGAGRFRGAGVVDAASAASATARQPATRMCG